MQWGPTQTSESPPSWDEPLYFECEIDFDDAIRLNVIRDTEDKSVRDGGGKGQTRIFGDGAHRFVSLKKRKLCSGWLDSCFDQKRNSVRHMEGCCSGVDRHGLLWAQLSFVLSVCLFPVTISETAATKGLIVTNVAFYPCCDVPP